jgi:Flp pilus assembly secretin CpaC
LPESSITVTSIKDTVVLTGTVTTRDQLQLLLEVAERFFPNTISRVNVIADRTNESGRPDQKPQRKRRRESAELKELREEVKTLRDDVRRLSGLVEKFSTTVGP